MFDKYSFNRSWRDGAFAELNFPVSICSGGTYLCLDNLNKLSLTFVPPISAINTGYLFSILKIILKYIINIKTIYCD